MGLPSRYWDSNPESEFSVTSFNLGEGVLSGLKSGPLPPPPRPLYITSNYSKLDDHKWNRADNWQDLNYGQHLQQRDTEIHLNNVSTMRLKCSFFPAKIVFRKLSTSLKIGLTVCNSKFFCVIKLVNHNVLIQYPLHCLWDYWGVKHGDSAFYAAWRTSSHHSRNNLEMERVKKTIDTYEGCFQWSPPCLSTKSVIYCWASHHVHAWKLHNSDILRTIKH